MTTVAWLGANHSASMLRAKRLLPLAAAVALCISTGGRAATITVDDASTNAGGPSGNCNIIDAVTAINTQAAVKGCVRGDGINDTIDLTGFTAPTTIAFKLVATGFSHALALNKDVTIIGTLDSGGLPYVTLERDLSPFTPNFGLIETTAALTIYGLTLSNGSIQTGTLGGGAIQAGSSLIVNNSVIISNFSSTAGGGIAASNSVTLNHSTVSGNTAANAGGGIYSTSPTSIVRIDFSTISGNLTTSASGLGGGGIYSSGSVVVGNSTISNNISATDGGGINTSNSVTLSASTLSGNTAQAGAGGAVFAINAINSNSSVGATASTINGNSAFTDGGGINANDASLTNSTITGNTANGSGGGGVHSSTVSLNYCTVFANTSQFGNGGGVDFAASGTATGTILFGNMPRDVNSAIALAGSFDIIANSTSGVPVGTLICNPMLGTLGNYGGFTMTLPLMNGSCALDAASATPSVITDQRGYARPAVGESRFKADIGAFERQAFEDPDLIFANGFE